MGSLGPPASRVHTECKLRPEGMLASNSVGHWPSVESPWISLSVFFIWRSPLQPRLPEWM